MGTEARARLAFTALLAVTLLSFERLFATGDYGGPALLAIVLAMGIMVAARRLGLGTGTTLLVAAAALFWYVTLVFEAGQTFYGLPTGASTAALVDVTATAYDHSRVDYAPIPMRPGYLILTVAAVWAAAAVGEVATFRWRRPIIASLGPLVLFSFLMVVGDGEGVALFVVLFLAALLAFWALESSHRIRTWGRWVSAWSDRAGEEPRSVSASVARRMATSCLAAALMAPIVLPAIEDGLLSWRSGAGGDRDGTGVGSDGERTVDQIGRAHV